MPVREVAPASFALLYEAGARIGTTLDLARTAHELMDVAVPAFADSGGVMIMDQIVTDYEFPVTPNDGSALVRRMAIGYTGPGDVWQGNFPLGEVVHYPATTPHARAMFTARTIVVDGGKRDVAPEISQAWQRPSIKELLEHNSHLFIPLVARGKVLGVVALSRTPERGRFSEADRILGEELVARATVCIDNARLYNRERRTALTLQRSLLPERLTAPPGITIAHRYLPGSDVAEVGGDWYDVIPLSGGRVALVAGDVMGHGVHAAAVMGQLRTAVRTLADLDLSTEEILERLDELMSSLGGSQFATCVYAVYDPVTREAELIRAGHVPPILRYRDGTTELLDGPPGTPLGIGVHAEFRSIRRTLPEGAILVLYTDGLVENRNRDIDTGLGELRATLARPDVSLPALCERVVGDLYHERHRDDIAVLMARVDAIPTDTMARWRFPGTPSDVSRARGLTRDTLAEWRLEPLHDVVVLLVSELMTNAIQRSTGPVQVRLLRDRRLLVEVTDTTSARPTLRHFGPTDERGRGLFLVNELARRWGTRRAPTGKTVWFEVDLPSDL